MRLQRFRSALVNWKRRFGTWHPLEYVLYLVYPALFGLLGGFSLAATGTLLDRIDALVKVNMKTVNLIGALSNVTEGLVSADMAHDEFFGDTANILRELTTTTFLHSDALHRLGAFESSPMDAERALRIINTQVAEYRRIRQESSDELRMRDSQIAELRQRAEDSIRDAERFAQNAILAFMVPLALFFIAALGGIVVKIKLSGKKQAT